ncbi:LOW QUALITY PROTEIN: cell division cycle-associated protein 2 [Cottoperca gobio]|uniref:LOW QUALITY PROTEIN: cell division cycle-associated protein 2 n=1 Tax=Cottoperca gobio TaxID=56716 RepID=A0A6J2QDS0_COTGO|nr:LOW QUALITY PROTEIN: cell division cycle-associated protein 2 [Cottoperca gobio]
MATVEMNTSSPEGDQKENLLPPSEEDSLPVLIDTTAPMNFSDLTPCQFGISVQSFTPASLSNRKDKSRLAQMKVRRRSNIGVRGSPETNSLIRFIAQQRMKTPPISQTPELVRSSPLLPRVASTLRQKMASFQSLMDVEESEVCDPMPRQDSNTGGCIKTRDYLSDGNSHYGGKENHPPMMTPIPSKRRRLGPGGCEVASAPIHPFSLKEHEEEEEQETLPSSDAVQEAQTVLLSPNLHIDFELRACSRAKNQQDGVFELQSLGQPPADDPAAASPAWPASPFCIRSLPSLLEMKPTGEDDSTGTSAANKKKKSVRFGCPLSPEFFDKNLPPSTPLQKGGTPARAPTPGVSLQPCSVLKTPQRVASQTSQAQPDLSSPTDGASPPLAMSRNRRMSSVGEDREEEDGEIVFPSVEEIDSAATRDPDCTWYAQRLNLNAAFLEESLAQVLTESEPSAPSLLEQPPSEEEKQHEAAVEAPALRPRNRTKQSVPEQSCSGEAPARCSGRKRKQPEESQPVKRSTRSAAKSASGKMKMKRTAARRWSRGVDRSLYGSRAYASKNPNLSPITEKLCLSGGSAAAQHTPSTSCTATNHETHENPELLNDDQAIVDFAVTNALESPSEDSVTSQNSTERTAGRGRGLAEQRVRGGAQKTMKVSVAEEFLLIEETLDETGGTRREDQTSTDFKASREPAHPIPEEVDTEGNAQTSADTHCTDSDEKLESHGSLDAPTSDCLPSDDESNNMLPVQRKATRGGRSAGSSAVLQELAEERQTSHEAEEKGQGDQAASQQEDLIRSSSDSQEEGGVAPLYLAPWQAEFNLEDVFKPVATRGQRSVRRSLRNQRNQSNAEHGSHSVGLAWLPRTSPESSKEARRRTQGRRLSSATPVQPSLPEEAS